jgi:hypothetical protein
MFILADVEAFWGCLEVILGSVGQNLARLERPRGPKRDAKRDPRGTRNDTQIASIF